MKTKSQLFNIRFINATNFILIFLLMVVTSKNAIGSSLTISGPSTIILNEVETFTGEPGESVWRNNANIGISLNMNGPWGGGLNLPSGGDGTFYVKGLSLGVSQISGTISPSVDVEVVESTVPIKLESFSINLVNNQPLLNWKTVTEINNDYFKIERSNNGYTFQNISKVKGSGTSFELHKYKFTDETKLNRGTYYYRLSQVDFDGERAYFGVKSITIDDNYDLIEIFPNPVKSGKILTIQSSREVEKKIIILDESGKIYRSIVSDEQVVRINTNGLNSGIYFVRIEEGGMKKVTRKLVID